MAQCPCGPLTLPLVRAAGVIRRHFADASLAYAVYFAWAGGFSEWACDGELSATTELGSAALRVPELAHAASVVRSFNLPFVRYLHSPANASFAMWGVGLCVRPFAGARCVIVSGHTPPSIRCARWLRVQPPFAAGFWLQLWCRVGVRSGVLRTP